MEILSLQFSELLSLDLTSFGSKAQPIESLRIAEALKSVSRCKATMLKIRYKGGMVLNKGECLKAHCLGAHKTRARSLNILKVATSTWYTSILTSELVMSFHLGFIIEAPFKSRDPVQTLKLRGQL